ncbi:uncharacterized protein ACLA_079500 [Aspergillus clavatus NRRL 1]|uniref:Uncharacterized protein n=1 Tax=Aspergillus clavatus (strain ATCC 1007 / CBS 513.65 / DSM 816 / NCTC 3887 / NRRL 1 / QM 1276 / 107) TaxID=344612 RepID=A1CSH9_ASPCL|nr:uncharacterized protein ACLA_079500 [Aspergillus clavatus NRRL 1]EAW06266.1 conserved hypothetical protein [Aspergillus clavatus NRRL 1]
MASLDRKGSQKRSPEIDLGFAPDKEMDNATGKQPALGGEDSDLGLQLESQTPTTKAQEQAIYSSPTGERGATGSRPPTRARGYSATLSVGRRRGDMSSKIPATPGFESSILSNFRRRPRQPSILQMMQADDGSSDLGDLDDDDFLGGLSPEDESTPLNLSRAKSLLPNDPGSSPTSDNVLPSTGGSRKRKRAAEQLQVPQSPLEIVENTPPGSVEIDDGERNTSDRVTRLLEYSEATSQAMAPPASSSPLSSPRSSPPMPVEEPLQTITDGKLMLRNQQAKSENAHVSTAALQDRLLPRRRQRHRKRRGGTTYNVSSDGSEDNNPVDPEEDELSYLPTRKPVRTQQQRKGKPAPLGTVRSQRKKHITTTVASSRLDPRSASVQLQSIVRDSRQPRTYGSQTSGGNKENQAFEMSSPLSSPLDTDEFDIDSSPVKLPAANFLSEELKLQAKKFQEVDKWEMDFEDVVTSGSQTSPCR